jgi:multidrug resistance efflux pump
VFGIAECTTLGRIIPSSPPFAIGIIVIFLVALVGGAIAWAALTEAELVVRAPARVRARAAPHVAFTASSGERVMAQTAGRVATVLVREGARVKAGDRLAILGTEHLANDLAGLEAALGAARKARETTLRMQELAAAQFDAAQSTRRADLAQVERDEARGRSRRNAEIAVARTGLAAAKRDAERTRALEGDGAASPAQVEQAQSRVDEATARLRTAMVAAAGGRAEVLRKQIVQAERDFAVHREELAQQLSRQAADLEGAERRVSNARLELAKGIVYADTAGVIGTVSVSEGDIVEPGHTMFVMSPDDRLRVDAAVGVADVALLRPGMPVRVRIDAFDWQRYGTVTGVIRQISPDAESIDGRGGALAYTVRVELDSEELHHGSFHGELKLGMTGMAEVITGRERLLALLFGRIHQAFTFGG